MKALSVRFSTIGDEKFLFMQLAAGIFTWFHAGTGNSADIAKIDGVE